MSLLCNLSTKNPNLFFLAPKLGNSRVKLLTDSVSGRISYFADGHLLPMSFHGGNGGGVRSLKRGRGGRGLTRENLDLPSSSETEVSLDKGLTL